MKKFIKFILSQQGKQNKKNGFTLIETLVAVSIFTMSIMALLVVLTQGIANNNYAKKKILASYLAQEGIYTGVPGNSWNGFKAKLAPCNPGNGCRFDTVFPHVVVVCNDPNNCKLYESNGSYSTNPIGGADSGFVRKIWMTTVNVDEVKIFSDVSWTQGSGSYSITFSENLFNWIE